MTSKTTFLKLQLYDTATDGPDAFYNFVGDISGTSASSNMKLIDTSASQTSASIVAITGSIVVLQNTPSSISGSSVMSTTTGSVVKHNVSGITAGSYTTVMVDKYGHVTAGSQTAVNTFSLNGRVGGDPTNWNIAGTSSASPVNAKVEIGVVRVTWPGSQSYTTSTVTFPNAFAAYPIVYITRLSSGNSGGIPSGEATSISTTGFVCYVYSGVSVGNSPQTGTYSDMAWMAIGP